MFQTLRKSLGNASKILRKLQEIIEKILGKFCIKFMEIVSKTRKNFNENWENFVKNYARIKKKFLKHLRKCKAHFEIIWVKIGGTVEILVVHRNFINV